MNHIRLFVALVAACILIMPALSMPNNEIGQDQKQCNCQNSPKDCTQMYHGQDGKEKSFDCQNAMNGEDGKKMGQGHKSIKSMMGDKGREDKTEIKIVIINVNT